MVRAFVAFNADAYCIQKSVIGLPETIMESEYMQCLLSDTLIMATKAVVPKLLPPHIAKVSRKSLLVDTPEALSSMAANLDPKDVGTIAVMANENIIDEMDSIGMSYELVVIYPTGTTIDDSIKMGKKLVDSQVCDKYCVERYQQSVSDASDIQIAHYIDGMESYFNMVDNMDKRDSAAVEKIARGVKMLNKAIEHEADSASSDVDSYGDVEEIEDEIDRVWDAMQMIADQFGEMSDHVISTQETVANVLEFLKNNPPLRNFSIRVNMLNDEIDGLRRQLGAHIEESIGKDKPKRAPLVWIVLAMSALSLVLSIINLCL